MRTSIEPDSFPRVWNPGDLVVREEPFLVDVARKALIILGVSLEVFFRASVFILMWRSLK